MEAELEHCRIERNRFENELRTATMRAEMFETKSKRVQNDTREYQDKIRSLEQEILRLRQEKDDFQVKAGDDLRDLQEQFDIERRSLESALEDAARREEEVRTQERVRSAELQAALELLEQEKSKANATTTTTAKKKRPRRGTTEGLDADETKREQELSDLRARVEELEAENKALSTGAAVSRRFEEINEQLATAQRRERKLSEEVQALQQERRAKLEISAELAEVRAQLTVAQQEARRLIDQNEDVSGLKQELTRWQKLIPGATSPSEVAIMFSSLDKSVNDLKAELSGVQAKSNFSEQKLRDAKQTINQLQGDLEKATKSESTAKAKQTELEKRIHQVESERSAAEKVLSSISVPSATTTNEDQIKVLSEALEKARKEVSDLEFHARRLEEANERLVKSLGQGQFDSTRTRVLHVKPSARADAKPPQPLPQAQQSQQSQQQQIYPQPIQGEDPEKYRERLKALFRSQVGRYKEAVFLLFGWKLEMTVEDEPQLRLRSMFAEKPDDLLMFKMHPETSTLDLLETDFGKQLGPSFLSYLVRANSPPAFLSAVQLELFSLQTNAL